MSVVVNLQKHYKANDTESSSGFDPTAIPFIPRAYSLKLENSQEFNLQSRGYPGVGKRDEEGSFGRRRLDALAGIQAGGDYVHK
eukprot:9049522-Ditylum_brightwellii.AAC.1